MSKENLATIPNDLLPVPECAKRIDRTYTTLYNQIRRGKIAVHFLAGDTQAKVSLAEVTAVFEKVRKRFGAPTFRVVRHDAADVAAVTEKSDLFA